MTTALFVALLFAFACAVANTLMLWIPPRRSELSLWRKLNLQALRRRLTRRRKLDQPLSTQTIATARRNIAWHIALSLIMFVIVAKALRSNSIAFQFAALLSVLPCIAWLIGSAVQRHKIALITFAGRALRDGSSAIEPTPR